MKREQSWTARLRVNIRLTVSLAVLMALAAASIAVPFIASLESGVQSSAGSIGDVLATRLVPPFSHDSKGNWHLFGTDAFGRDISVRLWKAGRVSIGVGVLGSLLAGALGIALGAVAAWRGGVIDRAVTALGDAMLSIPRLVLLLVIAALWGPGLMVVVTVLALTGWMSVMRLVRSDILGVKVLPYVEGALALGVPSTRLVVRHVLPNALGSAIVAMSLGVGNAILLESGLSFLGLGIQPPAASWGNMIAGGREWLLVAPWIALIPGIALIITVVASTIIGDSLSRDGAVSTSASQTRER